jgi:hypothetical protein
VAAQEAPPASPRTAAKQQAQQAQAKPSWLKSLKTSVKAVVSGGSSSGAARSKSGQLAQSPRASGSQAAAAAGALASPRSSAASAAGTAASSTAGASLRASGAAAGSSNDQGGASPALAVASAAAPASPRGSALAAPAAGAPASPRGSIFSTSGASGERHVRLHIDAAEPDATHPPGSQQLQRQASRSSLSRQASQGGSLSRQASLGASLAVPGSPRSSQAPRQQRLDSEGRPLDFFLKRAPSLGAREASAAAAAAERQAAADAQRLAAEQVRCRVSIPPNNPTCIMWTPQVQGRVLACQLAWWRAGPALLCPAVGMPPAQ